MQKVKWKVLLGITLLILSAFALPSYGANDVPRIGTEELKDLLGSPDLVILDARTAKDWKKSDSKVAGAVRVDPHDVSSWEADFSKDNQTIVYCAGKGEATSASVAGRLMELGFKDVYALKGGWKEWVKKDFPTEPK